MWAHIFVWAPPFILLVILVLIWGIPKPNVSWKWLVGILVLGLVGWGIWWFINRPAKPVTPPPTYFAPPTPVEALVLTESCTTPCSAYAGWKYKIRTDGDPFRVKYHGCKDWVERSGKGNFKAPECFQPGIAQFESGDKENPTILIQIYKKVNI